MNHVITPVVSIFLMFVTAAGCTESISDTNTNASSGTSGDAATNASSVSDETLPGTSEMFTDRDLEQTADTSAADTITLTSGEDVSITREGVYVISGSATNATIIVAADAEAKVQLVLDGVSVSNQDSPVVYVKSADKVFVTTTDSDNTMTVSGTFAADGDTNLDAVIFSRDDLVFNGTGSLKVVSALGNGITSKDDLKVTGGTLYVTSALDGLEANDSIRICGGEITVDSQKDGLHAEYDEDDTVGYIYMSAGTLHIAADDDGIRATTLIQIDGGTIDVETSTEGIEATYIQINDGNISVHATDDGINATKKSSACSVVIEVNGGIINVEVEGGDVDGFDANGSIYINGGTINIICPTQPPSGAFDADDTSELNGGTVTVNGEVITEIVESMMGPGGRP